MSIRFVVPDIAGTLSIRMNDSFRAAELQFQALETGRRSLQHGKPVVNSVFS
jgi:hypothetical protein